MNTFTVTYGGWFQRTTLHLTEIYDFSAYTHEDLIWNKERLLKNYDITVDGKYYERAKEETGF